MMKTHDVRHGWGAAALLCLMMMLCLLPALSFAEGAGVSALTCFDYTLNEQDKTVTLTRYKAADKQVNVAGSYEIGGVSYRTLLDASSVFTKNKNITGMTIGSGVGLAGNSAEKLFYYCDNLQQIDVSGLDTSDVTTMQEMFSCCERLTQLTGYENWDTGKVENMYKMFNYVSNLVKNTTPLEVIDLSAWDLDQVKNTGTCFQRCAAKRILLPDNLAVIGSFMMNHASNVAGETFTVPAGVKAIGGGHTFHDFGTSAFKAFEVDKKSRYFKAADGVLYSADGKRMLGIPRGKRFENDVFVLPEGVEFLGECSFSYNYNVKTLVLPDSLEYEPFVRRYDPRYITYEDRGNLNYASNLSLATYAYGGTKAYETKATNTRYTAKDGVLYTRDMQTLLAVPYDYDRLLDIPEGVTSWKTYAVCFEFSGACGKCTGVRIPASMSYIAQDQVDYINKLRKASTQFTIEVASGNKNYAVGSDGLLYAVRIPPEAIHLSQMEYICDGTEKKPEVKVSLYEEEYKEAIAYSYGTHNGDCSRLMQVLTEGEDYTVEYVDNIRAGTATVRVHGMGAYSGVTEKTFVIRDAYKPENCGLIVCGKDAFAKLPPVSVPTLILPDGAEEDWILVYELLPGNDRNKVKYDICLVNRMGQRAAVPDGAVLCLPYPAGMDEKSCGQYRIMIRHFGEKRTEQYDVKDGSIEMTPQGMCIAVSSFSPFEIKWEEAADVRALPATGDSAPLAPCLLTLALSCAALMILRRKADCA